MGSSVIIICGCGFSWTYILVLFCIFPSNVLMYYLEVSQDSEHVVVFVLKLPECTSVQIYWQ